MKKAITNKINRLYIKAQGLAYDIRNGQRGDTNFVSMLLIIGIVVVIAGLFLTFGKGVMSSISKKVNDFINKL